MDRHTVTFEEEIEKHGFIVYTNVGVSMMPLIRQGRDLVEIHKRPEGRLKKYDAVLYKSGTRYLLHRIIKVRENDYIILGDNNIRREIGIKDEQIFGILTAVVRDGKRVSVTDRKYLAYVHLWCDFWPIRIALIWTAHKCRAVLGRIKRIFIKKDR